MKALIATSVAAVAALTIFWGATCLICAVVAESLEGVPDDFFE